MKNHFALGLGAVVASLAFAAGCSTEVVEGADGAEQDLIAGTDAVGVEFDAVGMLVTQGNDGSGSICTGTLIAPKVVLTAKHCVMKNPGQEGTPTNPETGKVYFLIGQNGKAPTGGAMATKASPAFIYSGGYTSLGSDVAIYTLDRALAIEPLRVADQPPTDVGTPYLAVGYGRQNAQGANQTRKMGTVTLRTVTGAPGPVAFPTVEEYWAFIQERMPEPLTDAQKEGLKTRWAAPLSDSYEVYAGAAPGDSQVCHGDSGGPLLKKDEAGKWVVYGVASTTMAESNNLCQRGGMYATFGGSTRKLIADSIGDHCAVDDTNGALTCGQAAAQTTCGVVASQTEGEPTPYTQCLTTECCAETSACFGDAACSALSQCFSDCNAAGGDDVATCQRACYVANSGAYTKYLGYTACARRNCVTPAEAATSEGPSPTQAAQP